MTRIPGVVAGVVLCTVAMAACGGTASTSAARRPPGHGSASPTSVAPSPAWRATHAAAAYAAWRLPFPVARAALTSRSGDPRHVLLAGGMLRDDSSTGRVVEIDPTSGRTTRASSLAIAVHDAAGGSFAGHPAVYGGGNSTEQSAVQALVGGRWRQVARLPTTRSDLSVATVAGESLVIGGYGRTSVRRPILSQRDHRLRQLGSLRRGVRYAATALVGHSVYVFGGEVGHRELDGVQRVGARTGRTSVVAHLPRPLGHAVAAYVGGRVLLLGGRVAPDTQTDAMWWFDPADGRFTPAGRLPEPVSDASVVSDGRRVWLLGGETPAVTDRVVVVAVS